MKKFLAIVGFLTVITTPAFAKFVNSALESDNALRIASSLQNERSGNRAFARKVVRAKPARKARNTANDNTGIFENLPAGVVDPYAYHNSLQRIN